ncbi:MAG TPA: DUF4255 domain-containing protein [Thermoanaerobaculia bacterium]|jgi:hypothetical protein
MSNFLAVATVTAALRRTLQAVVSQDVTGATVTSVHPAGPQGSLPAVGVNIFLYQVVPNPDWRNNDLPTRRSDGSLLQLPEAAIDLHYLFSFHGDDAQLESHRLLGSVTRTLHAQPILDRQTIEDTVADPAFSFLAASDLADQVEKVRFVPQGSLEELSQLWTGIFHQTQYHLSVSYRGSVVLLTAEQERPKPALPVRRRQFLVLPLRSPAIDQVTDAADPAAPVVVGSTIEITGRRLRGAKTVVRLTGQDFEPADDDVTDGAIRFLLDAPLVAPDLLRAGVQAVQVIHPFLIGEPPQERAGSESNPAPLVLVPDLANVQAANVQDLGGGLAGADVTLEVTPPAGSRQRVNLVLSSVPGTAVPQAYSFSVPARTSDLASLTIPVSGVVQGTYLVRLQVDGASSPLAFDDDPESPTFEQFTGPTVVLEPP